MLRWAGTAIPRFVELMEALHLLSILAGTGVVHIMTLETIGSIASIISLLSLTPMLGNKAQGWVIWRVLAVILLVFAVAANGIVIVGKVFPQFASTAFGRFVGVSVTPGGYQKFPEPYGPTIVSHKTFKNEVVPLDWYEYDDCIFINVTFLYNGETVPRINRAKIIDSLHLKSENPAVEAGAVLLKVFGGDKVQLNLPPGVILDPMTFPDSPPR
jgi:hypothetical protein